ncbi:hypothetical protein D3C87_2034090 [compost metagenome]
MIDELISADHLGPLHLGQGLTGITVWCDNRPGIFIHEHLMYTHLMGFATQRESCMEEVEELALFLIVKD